MPAYKDKFYGERDAQTAHAARTILGLTLDLLPPVRSAIDVGCGVGTWLRVIQERGVATIRGLDGAWVRRDLLTIPAESFVAGDLRERISLSERFDLAISVRWPSTSRWPREHLRGSLVGLGLRAVLRRDTAPGWEAPPQ
jgi:hypothetical protein